MTEVERRFFIPSERVWLCGLPDGRDIIVSVTKGSRSIAIPVIYPGRGLGQIVFARTGKFSDGLAVFE